MTITDYNFLIKLKTEKINYSAIPKTIKKADYFDNLLNSGVIVLEGNSGRGTIKLNENQADYFEKFLENHFKDTPEAINRASNIKAFRNSKSRKTDTNAVVFLKGDKIVKINGQAVDLGFYTSSFGIFSTVLKDLTCEKICFVENLYPFLNIEKIMSNDYIFLHTYGRVGEKLLQNITVKEVLVFSDYDFIGLHEYLKFKEKFVNTSFYVPQNYEELFEKYSRPLRDNYKETTQKPTGSVLNSTDEVVIKIRNQIFEHQRFLEQEILIAQ